MEVIGVIAVSGYDQRDMGPDQSLEDSKRELPATVTLLVSPEQSKVLAELEADGKMHLSLVKSISRFARNIVDCLNYIRALRELGIAVIFEKENINTLESDSKMLITMMGAFTQVESESIS